ncbi:hypothetical protein ACFXJ5_38855 [Streptomyces sp. NPDC059373]
MEMVDRRGRALAVTPAAMEVLRSDPDLRFELAIDTVRGRFILLFHPWMRL